jgi:hypothetical protein
METQKFQKVPPRGRSETGTEEKGTRPESEFLLYI